MPVFTSSIEVTEDYPTIRPSLNLNFARSRALDSRIGFERSSTATYVGRDGLIKTADANEPRFDHDPETLESLGLLIEEDSTNLCVNSTASNSWGTPFQLVQLGTKSIVAPTGEVDAFEWSETTDSTTHLNNGPSINISSGNSYSISSFFKEVAGGNDRGYFLQWYKSGGQTVKVTYLPSTDTTSISTSNGASNPTNVSVVAYPDGWYKISFTATLAETDALAIVGLTDASGNVNFTGDLNGKHSFWGLQYEQKAFPTSHIPTSGVAVSRSDDFGYLTGTNFSSWFNQTEGSFDVAYRLGGDNVSMRVCQISNQNSNTVIDLVVGSGGGAGGYWYIITGGVAQFSSSGVTNSSQTDRNFRVVLAYKENDCAAQSNKITSGPTTDTNVTLVTDYDRLLFYQIANSADHINGHLKYIRYYPKRLTDAQVTLLSQEGF